jgi:hypothetical protein
VAQRVNHYFLDDEPVQIAITYILWCTAQGSVLAADANTGTGSIYARLAELGHDIMQAREEITARMPRPDEIAVLAIPAEAPVIEVLHPGIDQNGQPFEVARFVMRADVAALGYRLPVEVLRPHSASRRPSSNRGSRPHLGQRVPLDQAQPRGVQPCAGAVNATTPLCTLTIALAVRAQPALGTLRLIGLVLGFLETLTALAPWEDLGRGYRVGALLCLAASASYGASYVYVGRFTLRMTAGVVVVLLSVALTRSTRAGRGMITRSGPSSSERRTPAG